MRRLVPLLAFLAGSVSFASDAKTYFVSAGFLFQNVAGVSTTYNGSKELFSSPYIDFAASARWHLSQNWLFVPRLEGTPWGQSDNDGGARKRFFSLSLFLARQLGAFDLHAGPGVLFYHVSGAGGSDTLNNGNDYSVFFHPSGSSMTRNFFVAGGLGYGNTWRVDLDFQVVSPAASYRAVNMQILASYGFL